MKFTGKPNFYGYEDPKGFPGMKATSVVDTCESFTAEGVVMPGKFVARGTDKDNQVKSVSSASDIVAGVALHTHKEPTIYQDGDILPVMVAGEVYVECDTDVVAGDHAYYDAAGKIGNQTLASSTEVPNARFMESASQGEIVRLRLTK